MTDDRPSTIAEADVDVATLHRTLSRLAGRVSDAELTALRAQLVTDPAALHALLVADPAALPDRSGPADDSDPSSPFLFAPAPWPVLEAIGDLLGPCLDLTTGPDLQLASGLLDAVDQAAIAAVAAIDGALGLWRAWRFPPGEGPATRVFALETGPDAAPWLAAYALCQALAAVGEVDPQVEAWALGDEIPVYQSQIQAYAALLWSSAPTVPVEVAEVFDLPDAEGLGLFAPDHPQLTDATARERLLSYLDAGTVLLRTDLLVEDVVDPLRGYVVPLTVRTDGAWIWTDTVSYYLREHMLSPDPRLAEHVASRGELPPRLDGVAVFRALYRLQHLGDEGRPAEPVVTELVVTAPVVASRPGNFD